MDQVEQQKQEKLLLEAIKGSSSDSIIIVDREGRIIFWNKGSEKLFGYAEQEILGQLVKTIVPEGFQSGHLLGMQSVASGGYQHVIDSLPVELSGLKKDGTEILLELTLSEKDLNGSIVFVAIIRDIVERKKTERLLKENEEKYRALADSAPLCIKWFDSNGRLIAVNKYGQHEHYLENLTDEQIKNWDYFTCIESHCQEELKTKMKLAFEGSAQNILIEHVPGTTVGHYCQSNLIPVKNAEGKISYVLFISRDVTAEKATEEQKDKNLAELQKFIELTTGRELRMVELKKENEKLKEELAKKTA